MQRANFFAFPLTLVAGPSGYGASYSPYGDDDFTPPADAQEVTQDNPMWAPQQQNQGGQGQQGGQQGGQGQSDTTASGGQEGGQGQQQGGQSTSTPEQQQQQGSGTEGQGQGQQQQPQGGTGKGTEKPDASGQGGTQQGNDQPQQTDEERAVAEQVEAAQAMVDHWSEKGILLPIKDKKYDLATDEGQLELQLDSARNHIKNMVSKLPDSQRSIVNASLAGATTDELRQLILVDSHLPDFTKYDPTNADHAKYLLEQVARLDLGADASEDDVADYIDPILKIADKDRQQRVIGNKQKQLVAAVNQERQDQLNTINSRVEADRKTRLTADLTQMELIRKTESVAGIPVPVASRESLAKYLYERDENGKTAFDRDAELPQMREALGFFLMNKFDVSKILPGSKAASGILSHMAKAAASSGRGSSSSATSEQAQEQAQKQAVDEAAVYSGYQQW